jgi:hypothetical protein
LEVTDGGNFCTATVETRAFQELLTGFTTASARPDCSRPLGTIIFEEVFGGTAPYLFSFDGGETFGAATVADSLTSGRYELIVQDALGYEFNQAVEVPAAPQLELALDNSLTITIGDSVRLDVRSNYADTALVDILWSPATGLSCGGCLRAVAVPQVTTT